jgi:hypothetical protein
MLAVEREDPRKSLALLQGQGDACHRPTLALDGERTYCTMTVRFIP